MIWFDREPILGLLNKRIEGFLAGYRQNLALVGAAGVGKSTLLKRLVLEKPVGPSTLLVAYLEIQAQDSFPEWALRAVQVILDESLRAQGIQNPPVSLPQRLQWLAERLPQSARLAQRLAALAEAGDQEELYSLIWDLPQTLSQELGIPFLLLLDEFQRLESWGLKNPYERLGRKIMVQNNTLYLLASSAPQRAKQILKEGLSLLFGQFDIIEMGPLEFQASSKALRPIGGSQPMDPFLEHLILHLTRGFPGVLDLFLKGLAAGDFFRLKLERERILVELLEELLLAPEGVLRNRFEEKLRALPFEQNRLTWIRILGALSRGNHRLAQMVQAVQKTPSQIRRGLSVLQEAGLVAQNGSLTRISDPLFELWIQAVYPLRERGGFPESASAKEFFREVTSGWIEQVRQAVHRPFMEQTLRWLRQWSGEWITLEGRRLLLPFFARVDLILGPLNQPAIAAHRKDSEGKGWLLIPALGPLNEGQGRQWAQALLPGTFQGYPKVLLGSFPVEMNARVILQGAGIRVWDLAALNEMFQWYGLETVPFPQGPLAPLAERIALSPFYPESSARSS